MEIFEKVSQHESKFNLHESYLLPWIDGAKKAIHLACTIVGRVGGIHNTNASANLGLRVSDHNVPMHNLSTIDKVQGKFLKFSLGLSKFASTSAVL